MDVTQKLMNEHQLILKYTQLLEGYVLALKEDPYRTELVKRLGDFISFVREYADQYHHAKEEEILFKFMEEPGVLSHCNPLPQMNYEHEEGRKYIRGMKDFLSQGDTSSALRFAWGWLQLLRDHISKEDNILYPMAEEGIQQDRKNEILKHYSETEKRLGGPELEVKYQTLFKELLSLLEKNTGKFFELRT